MTLKWNGDKVISKLKRAQIIGVNATMAQAVSTAKRNHDWRNRTGTLEGSIKIVEYAKPFGSIVKGTWGSTDVVYALIHELGGKIVPVRAPRLVFQVDGRWVSTLEVNIPARPYLRPAADVTYPELASNIKKARALL